jgi:hypothetical protein
MKGHRATGGSVVLKLVNGDLLYVVDPSSSLDGVRLRSRDNIEAEDYPKPRAAGTRRVEYPGERASFPT